MKSPPAYVFPSSDAEARRLGLQAMLYGGLEILEPVLASGPTEVLDAGSGAGHYAALLARRLPGAHVTGVERDARRVTSAANWHRADNLTFTRADMLALPFEGGRFDLSLTRFVLAFQRDACDAVRELARVTRPGGRVACHEMIHDGIWFAPARPALTQLLGQVMAHMRRRQMRPNQGLHMAGAMTRAGLKQVQVTALSHMARGPGPRYEATRKNWQEMTHGMAQEMTGLLDPELGRLALEELEQEREEDLFLEISTLAVGVVP